jgi:hypothetical protein
MTAGTCPFCGTDTGFSRQPEPELGTLSIDEFEALVRGEWRLRLGAGAYDRAHSAGLVRALLVYGLKPDSPVRCVIAGQLLYRELTKYGTSGAGQREIRRELRVLLEAVDAVLRSSGVTPARAEAFVTALVDQLRDALGWWIVPPEPDAVERPGGEEAGTTRLAGAAAL